MDYFWLGVLLCYVLSVLVVTLMVYGLTPHDCHRTEWETFKAAIKVGGIWPIWLIVAIVLILFQKVKERKCLKSYSTRRF